MAVFHVECDDHCRADDVHAHRLRHLCALATDVITSIGDLRITR
jgi:hypothetical protein